MHKHKIVVLGTVVLSGLLLASGVLAMFSDNYLLDWFTPLTGGGGGPASSTHYAINFTMGQSAIGAFASTNYKVRLGYWCGLRGYRTYLPLVLRAA